MVGLVGQGLQDHDASDVTQEVFRSVATNIDSFRRERQGDSFRGWLWTICRNKVRDHFRSLENRPAATGNSNFHQLLQRLPETLPDEDSDNGQADKARIHMRALKLIEAEFPVHQWQAFLRVTAGGEKPAHVAEDLKISVWSVYQAKSRVLRRLRTEVARFG